MKDLNKYGNLSWGYIFDYLDKAAHVEAIGQIGECVTVSADIKYFDTIEDEDLEFNLQVEIFRIGNNKCHVQMQILDRVFANFLFVKLKGYE